jgi:transcriptional regulator with XRE-family HTH domain
MEADEKKTRRKPNELGPTGQAVARNVGRLRTALGLSTYRLAGILADLGRPIAASAITKIENGSRRVDTDDLMALAVAFDVPPSALLLEPVSVGPLVLLDDYEDMAAVVWDWAEGKAPLRLPEDDDGEYWNAWQSRSKPAGRREFRMTARAEAKATATAEGVLDRLAKHRHRRPLTDPDAE